MCSDSKCDENDCQVETQTLMNNDLKCDSQGSTTEANPQTFNAQPVTDNMNSQINNTGSVDDSCIIIDDSGDDDVVTALECEKAGEILKYKAAVGECDLGNCKDIALHDTNKVSQQFLSNENPQESPNKDRVKCSEVSPTVISPSSEFKNRHWMDFLGNEDANNTGSPAKSCVKKLIVENDNENGSKSNDIEAMDVDDESTWKLEYCDSLSGTDATDIIPVGVVVTKASNGISSALDRACKSNCEADLAVLTEKTDPKVSKQVTETSATNVDSASSILMTDSEGIKPATDSSATNMDSAPSTGMTNSEVSEQVTESSPRSVNRVPPTVTTDSEVCKPATESLTETVDENPWKLEYSTSSDDDDDDQCNTANVTTDHHKNVITRQNCEQSKDVSRTPSSDPSASSRSDVISTNDCQKINAPERSIKAGEIFSVEIGADVLAQSVKTISCDNERRDNLFKTDGKISVSGSSQVDPARHLSTTASTKMVIMHDTGTSCDNFYEEKKKETSLSVTEHCYFKKSGPLRSHTRVQFTTMTIKRSQILPDHPKDFNTIHRKLLDFRYKTIVSIIYRGV